MRKLLALLLLAVALPAVAQFVPPPPAQSGLSGVGFFATGKTSWLAGTTTSAAVGLSTTANAAASQVQVYNAGTTLAYIACATSTIVAAVGAAGTFTSDYPVGPGAIVVITVSAGTNYCAGIYGTGSGAIYFTPGSGL